MHADLQDHRCRLRTVVGDLETRTDFHEYLSARASGALTHQSDAQAKVPSWLTEPAAETLTATFMARWSDARPINVPSTGIAAPGSSTTATRTRFWLPIAPLDGSKSTQPGPGTNACTQAWVLPPVILSSSASARLRYPDTKRAAMPSVRMAAIISIARSRQLPLPSAKVSTGSRVPFWWRASCLKVRLMCLVMSMRSVWVSADPSSRRNPAAQRASSGWGEGCVR